jgi:anti-sigma B factor antagonist
MSPVHVNTRTIDGASVIQLEGTIDGSSAPAAQAAIVPLLEPGCRLVLDLAGVDFMSSAGLRLMLLIFRQVSGAGGKVAMIGLSEEIRDTMSLTGFLDFFTTADSEDAALLAVHA